MTATNTDLIRLLVRSLDEHRGQWVRKRSPALIVYAAELRVGVLEILPSRYRILVADGDDQGQTQIEIDAAAGVEGEATMIAELHAALAPWREEAAAEARQTALDRLHRQFGDEAPARSAAAERLSH